MRTGRHKADPTAFRAPNRDLRGGESGVLEATRTELGKLDEGILPAAFLTYPLLKTLSLQLHSAITSTYISGTHSVVFINCPNEQIARDIARVVLEKKLAASVNILPKASSLYFWKGEIEEATEIMLLIKTKTSKVPMLSSYIRLVHPFEIPEVFSLSMDQGDVHYLKWLEEAMEEN